MKRLLLSTVALLALTTASQAAFVSSLGNNPNSSTGHFSNSVNGATFVDDFTFTLSGAPQFVAFASATNDFVGSGDFITDFTGQLWSFGADLLPFTADDSAVNVAATAHPCTDNPSNCQELSGNAILSAGGYYLQFTGTGGGTAGYGGDLTTAAVPGPIAGAGVPGLMSALGGLWFLHRRRKSRDS